ncbi:MAG: alpha-galactosidase [Lautropia sp.]|nr:alpha-galactosidase [Lautropia sp.]
MSNIFHRLDSATQTIVFRVRDERLPEAVYWGPRLMDHEILSAIAAAQDHDLGSGMLDILPPLSICPESSTGFSGQLGLSLSDGPTRLMTHFRLLSIEHHRNDEVNTMNEGNTGQESGPAMSVACFVEEAGTKGAVGTTAAGCSGIPVSTEDEADDELTFRFADESLGLRYTARFRAVDSLVIASAEIESDHPLCCHWLSAPVMPAPALSDEILDWHGTWIREFHRQSTLWSHGIRMREARTGRSGHEHPPIAAIPTRGATRTQGTVHAMQLAWSGGHRFVAEQLADGRRQLQMGPTWDSEAPGTHFHSGELILAVSEQGEAGIASAFQRHIRDRIVPWPNPHRSRPVHYNCWEAIYFNHRFDILADMAERAAALGAERFVLDDGWFGRRDDDTSSLGDWLVDRRKWPQGLQPLIDKVHGFGMSFGLWVEPEMINRNSDLYRTHPEWVLGAEDQVTGRFQHVLDLSRPEVREHLVSVLDAILREYPAIDYLKWDHNRVLPVVDTRQTEGTYEVLDRLRRLHPAIEIESCASGGGRIDAGILQRTHRVWLSDSNDAIERLRIQHEAALFFPPAITGSHVGACKSHSSGRILPMAFRAWVAAQRHMGFEMDLRELTEEEALTLKRVTRWWKNTRDWRLNGITLPLESADPAIISEIQIADDGSRFVLFCGRHASSVQSLPRPQLLAGLNPTANYRLHLVNPEDTPPQSRGRPALLQGPLELSGRALMNNGIQLPLSWPATMWVVEGERL